MKTAVVDVGGGLRGIYAAKKGYLLCRTSANAEILLRSYDFCCSWKRVDRVNRRTARTSRRAEFQNIYEKNWF